MESERLQQRRRIILNKLRERADSVRDTMPRLAAEYDDIGASLNKQWGME